MFAEPQLAVFIKSQSSYEAFFNAHKQFPEAILANNKALIRWHNEQQSDFVNCYCCAGIIPYISKVSFSNSFHCLLK